MSSHNKPARSRRGRGGRAARVAARSRSDTTSLTPYITRAIPYFEVLSEEGLQQIEDNADIILEEIGIEFRDDPEALELWRQAGADVQGECVTFSERFVSQHRPTKRT